MTCGVFALAVQGLSVCIASLCSAGSAGTSSLSFEPEGCLLFSILTLSQSRTFSCASDFSSAVIQRLNLVLKFKSPSTSHSPNQIDLGLCSALPFLHYTLNSLSTSFHSPLARCHSSLHVSESRPGGQSNNCSGDPYESAMQRLDQLRASRRGLGDGGSQGDVGLHGWRGRRHGYIVVSRKGVERFRWC